MNAHEPSPQELLRLSGSYWQACALHAGVMLDLFTPLSQHPLDATELAARLGLDPRATAMLADALAAMGLLVKTGGSYACGATARECLVRDAPRSIAHIIRHHHRLMASWARLPEAVQGGHPIRERSAVGDGREDFLLGMLNLGMATAPELAGIVDLSGRKRLLDLGGGPGVHAIHFCLANPGLQAVIYDLPTTRDYAQATVERFGLSDRIAFVPGDFLQDPVPGGFDAVWLSHVLHAEGPEGCRIMLDKAARALTPGGLLLVHEFILNESMDGPLFPALFSLNMLLGTESGRSYSEAQLREMLAEAGGQDISRLDFTGPNDSGVLRAVVGSRPV